MMRSCVIGMSILLGLTTTTSVGAIESPSREKLKRDGWTIGFAPEDRALAEALAERLGDFEMQFAALELARAGFGPTELEDRAAEAAAQAAAWCALPERAADFERALQKAAARVTEIQTEVGAALQVRAIEIWRAADIQERLATGEPMPGVRWIGETKRLDMDIKINLQAHLLDGRISVMVSAPPAVMLQVPEGVDHASALGTLITAFTEWASFTGGPGADPGPTTMRLASHMGIARVLESETASDRSSRWIIEGISGWLWRELVFGTLKPEGAHRYATVVPQLLVPRAIGKPFDLKQWAEGDEDENLARARQVFNNIAEHHGQEAVTRVLSQFWKLPSEQRTTSGLKEVYRELMDEPLEARAPWRSLGPIP